MLSPTLFLVFIRDILHRMPKSIQVAIYADDLALWRSEEYITTANYRLQQALQVIESCARSWLVKVNEKKTALTIFSLSNQQQRVHLKPIGQTYIRKIHLHTSASPWIEVLPGKKQLQKNQARAKTKLALTKKLSCTEWDAQNMLKKIFGRICPVLEYGMAANSIAAKSNSSKLSRVQHQAMGMMTVSMLSSPISAMETVTGLRPVEDRQETKVLTQAAKFKRLRNHPMHGRMDQPKRGKLKLSSFIEHSRIFERTGPEPLDHMPKPTPSVKTMPSWKRRLALRCQWSQTEVVNFSQRGSH